MNKLEKKLYKAHLKARNNLRLHLHKIRQKKQKDKTPKQIERERKKTKALLNEYLRVTINYTREAETEVHYSNSPSYHERRKRRNRRG